LREEQRDDGELDQHGWLRALPSYGEGICTECRLNWGGHGCLYKRVQAPSGRAEMPWLACDYGQNPTGPLSQRVTITAVFVDS
jgi:hypothetical protein